MRRTGLLCSCGRVVSVTGKSEKSSLSFAKVSSVEPSLMTMTSNSG